MNENALEIRGLTKAFPGFTLGPLDLTLPSGCILGLIGENGAGKTTALKLTLGLVRPDEGAAHVLGRSGTDRETREHLGVVMDECGFPENLTLHDVDTILSRCYRTWDTLRFQGWADRFELPRKKAIKAFSRGMRMKLSIAAALSHDSQLLLLDEATSGLDPVVRDELIDLLLDFVRDENHAILISSHIVSDLEKLCDTIAFLHKGKLLLCEDKDTLREEYALWHGTAGQLEELDKNAIVSRRVTAYGAEALVKRELVPAGSTLTPVSIEELFVLMVKGENVR